MRPIGLLALLAAGCSHHDPRADAALFDSDGERARRDLFALYYSDDPDQGTGSIVISRRGTADAHFEPGPRMQETERAAQAALGLPSSHRHETGIPVTPAQMEALEASFAKFPLRETSWSLRVEPPMEYPERTRPPPARIRMLHVSRSGEVRTLIVYTRALPPDARPGGADLAALERLFGEIARRR